MIITKRYTPRDINFHLLPDLMEQIKSLVPKSMLFQAGNELEILPYFLIQTNSQSASTASFNEFRDFIRGLSEPILALDAELKCNFVKQHLSEYSSKPPVFEFLYRRDSIKIILARNTAENIRELYEKIEETLVLESTKPKLSKEYEENEATQNRTIFIAHSFDQIGKSYAYELIKFLNLLHFKVATGEGYSPERISKKVKDRLTSQEIVIVILSKKDDATWLIQEATGAAFINKPLILLIEGGVEFKPGILGDIEYIQFPSENISSSFVSILEGLQELGYSLS